MFAIKLKPTNLKKIFETGLVPESEEEFFTDWANRRPHWYFVRGYVSRSGQVFDFTHIPPHVVEESFHYNPSVIDHDWDQIVRKEKK